MADFTLGSMYWINPKYTLDDFREDMRRVRENRITLLRIFVLWEYVEVEKDRFDFTMYDLFFKAAEEYGIRLMPTLLFYLPFHRVVEQAAAGRSDEKRRIPCLDRPEIKAALERFFTETVCRYKDSPALAIWNIWNEPTDTICLCHDSLEHFAAWLKRRYTTFEALKEAWAGEYSVFNPVVPRSLEELDADWLEKALTLATRGRNTAVRWDLYEFQTDHAAGHVAYLSNFVKKYDAIHPTHSNPACTHSNPLYNGISPWKIAKSQDSTSCSIHPHSMLAVHESDPDRYPAAILSSIDKARSWTDGGEIWIGEYQAGSTYDKINAYTPGADDISSTLFHTLARGLQGLIFWEWQSWRSGVFEPGEFSLRNPSDGAPTERSEAAGEFGVFLETYQEYIKLLEPPRPRAAVLYSMDQAKTEKVLNDINPSSIPRHTSASWRCHQSLVNAGIQCDFITESQLTAEGRMDQYQILLLPHVRTISRETADAVERFVRNGGAVWADGRCGFLDKHIFLRNTVPCSGLDRVFGCREADEVAPRAKDLLILKDGSTLKPFREVQRLKLQGSAEVLAECNGYPAAVRNHYGKGTAELWGTYLSGNPDTDISEMLCKFAADHEVYPEIQISCGSDVIVSTLKGKGVLFAVFTSVSEKEQSVSARLPVSDGEIINDVSAVLSGKDLTFTLNSGKTLPVLIKTNS